VLSVHHIACQVCWKLYYIPNKLLQSRSHWPRFPNPNPWPVLDFQIFNPCELWTWPIYIQKSRSCWLKTSKNRMDVLTDGWTSIDAVVKNKMKLGYTYVAQKVSCCTWRQIWCRAQSSMCGFFLNQFWGIVFCKHACKVLITFSVVPIRFCGVIWEGLNDSVKFRWSEVLLFLPISSYR